MALPSDITQLLGQRDTADASSVSINPLQPFEIGPDIFRLDPNEHQLLSWVMTKARHLPTKTHKFGHMERAPHPNWVTYIGADESSQATTNLNFANASTRLTTDFTLGVARNGEKIHITGAVTGTQVAAVTRNFGTPGTPNLRSGDKCKILAPNHAEGFTMGHGVSAGVYYTQFDTSIVDWPVELTGTADAEETLEGGEFDVHLFDAWKDAEDQMEGDLFFGGKVQDNSGTHPLHAATGLQTYISTNVFQLPGRLTRSDLIDIIGVWKRFNKGGGGIICSGAVIDLINGWAYNKVTYNQDLKKEGINVSQFQTPRGLFDLIECDLFNQEENLMGTILFLPDKGIDYRPLNGKKNREIAYKPVEQDEVDNVQGRIIGEYGWEFTGEERFAIAKGIEF